MHPRPAVKYVDADTLTKQRRNIDIEMIDLYEDPIEMNFIKNTDIILTKYDTLQKEMY